MKLSDLKTNSNLTNLKTNQVRFIDGFSESAWKSLVVKSLRIGWIEGLKEAEKRLAPSTMKNLLIDGLFEDVFPAGIRELNECVQEIEKRDYESLCARNTHHGRGLTTMFCDLEKEACSADYKKVSDMASHITRVTPIKWINPRLYNCLYTWDKIAPTDTNKKRDVLHHPFTGMPLNILDAHTYEGKVEKRSICMLSGHYSQHRKIGEEVMRWGWDNIRERFVNDDVREIFPESLF